MYKLIVALSKDKIPKNIFTILVNELSAPNFDPLVIASNLATMVPSFARMLSFSYAWLNVLKLRYDADVRNKCSKEYLSISTGYALSQLQTVKENDVQRKCAESSKIAVQILSLDSTIRMRYSALVFEIIRLYFSQDQRFLEEVHNSGLDDNCWWKIL